jgi:hypothetical protein
MRLFLLVWNTKGKGIRVFINKKKKQEKQEEIDSEGRLYNHHKRFLQNLLHYSKIWR